MGTHAHDHTHRAHVRPSRAAVASLSLAERGKLLLAQGIPEDWVFRKLKREFPSAERLELKLAAGWKPDQNMPLWAQHNPLKPVTTRRAPTG